jgi:hypothetical protein
VLEEAAHHRLLVADVEVQAVWDLRAVPGREPVRLLPAQLGTEVAGAARDKDGQSAA